MNITTMLALLQAAASLLVSAQNPQTTPAMAQNAINLAGNVIQIVDQAKTPINFAVREKSSIWTNITDLLSAPYIDSEGNWVRIGPKVSILSEYTTFGDLNNDGFDDAAVIVNRRGTDGASHYFLAAMLNRGTTLFDIADFPLGDSVNIVSHEFTNGKIVLDGKKYELLGKELIAVL